MHALLLLHMLGCGGGHAAEREAYLAAVTGPIEEADEQCRHVEGTLGDDCRLLVAERRIEAGASASEACANTGSMADECWFVYAELAELGPERAAVSCRRAGDLQTLCRTNALTRGVARRVATADTLDGRFMLEIRALVREYGPDGDEPGRLARSLVAASLPDRWGDVSFDAALCGELAERVCAEAYALSHPEDPQLQSRVCSGPLDLESVTRAGARGWTDGGERLALAVWHQLCQREEPASQPPPPGPPISARGVPPPGPPPR